MINKLMPHGYKFYVFAMLLIVVVVLCAFWFPDLQAKLYDMLQWIINLVTGREVFDKAPRIGEAVQKMKSKNETEVKGKSDEDLAKSADDLVR